MARTSLTVTTTAASGTTWPALSAVDAANGNSFPNTGREGMLVTNGSSSTVLTATITTNGTYDVGSTSYAIADLTVVVATGSSKIIGPFDRTLFNDANGALLVDWSSSSSVTCGVFSLGTS